MNEVLIAANAYSYMLIALIIMVIGLMILCLHKKGQLENKRFVIDAQKIEIDYLSNQNEISEVHNKKLVELLDRNGILFDELMKQLKSTNKLTDKQNELTGKVIKGRKGYTIAILNSIRSTKKFGQKKFAIPKGISEKDAEILIKWGERIQEGNQQKIIDLTIKQIEDGKI